MKKQGLPKMQNVPSEKCALPPLPLGFLAKNSIKR